MTIVLRAFLACSALLILAPAPAGAAEEPMRFVNSSIESEVDLPRACFVFSRDLAARGSVRYEDYLRFTPDIQAEVAARGRRLCVSGFEHGHVYAATLLAGLPAADGQATADTEKFDIAIPDRQPSVNFKGASYILPGRGERALPIESVNVQDADLRILRINDRNLIGEINKGSISSLMSRWDVRRIAELDGELVWEGTVSFDMVRNKRVESAIPVGEILGRPEPGIYVLMAIPREERKNYVYYEATQWMVVTDIGVSTVSGRDGLHVFLRSLQDASPLAGHEVRLVSRNNKVLGTATTDRDGMARFAPGLVRGSGGARPGAVMAFAPSGGAFNFLDLTRPAFDLTDRGVGGRPGPGPVDAYVYTDRGVYRPGETAHVMVLARDDAATALTDLPLKLRILRPDGTEHDLVDLAGEAAAGAFHHAISLSGSARTGQWSVQAVLDPKAAPVGTGTFQVEDFVPERMEVSLEPRNPRLIPGEENAVAIAARFLYGAPGAGLGVTAELVVTQDMTPYPDFAGYKFGLVQEEWRPRRESLDPVKTDSEGRASVPVVLEEAPDTTRPLKALVRVSVSESGGRAVSRTVDLPIRTARPVVGIKPHFGDGWLEEGQPAKFDIVALGDDGAPIDAAGLRYELFYEEHRYHWYVDDGSWRYRVIIDETLEESGDLSVSAAAPAGLEFSKDWGRYRLEVSDPDSGAATSVRFRVGWFSSVASADLPDKLEVTLDKETYRVGETARVFIKPPFAGQVLMTVAGNRVYETRNLHVPRDGMVVELPVRAEWDAGAYVTATIFRAAEGDAPHRPARAVGLAWLARDYSARTLAVAIDAPERVTPRQTVEVELTVAGLASGEQAFATVAAVDQGILQLTRFETPDPAGWYFGKRRLGVDLRDGYGHLIESTDAPAALMRQGGDAAAEGRHLGGLDASSVKTVSLFSGILKAGAEGRVTVPLDVPDFNGRLRIMAVAWSADKVGSADVDMIVRDPVVSQVTLPRFLAPGDEAAVTVTVHNVDGPAGAYSIAFETNGTVEMRGNGVATDLEADARKDLAFSLNGSEVGVGALSLIIEGPEGLRLERDWEIAVRPAQAVATRHMTSRLQPGQSQQLSADILHEFVPGTGEATVALGARPDMGLAELLKSLDRYPYGCAEQTTSRALPLLYVAEIAASLGIAEDAIALRGKVEGAVRRVLTMQRPDGSFGLWNSSSPREEWLTAYVMDFLTQAKELGYPVPEYSYRRGLAWLEGAASAADYTPGNIPARVYGLHVLARAGIVRTRDLRYVHDVYLSRIPTALGRAQLGAALAAMGDRRRAEAAFASATRVWDRKIRFWGHWRFWDYGTGLRDLAGTVYLASLAGLNEGDWPSYAEELAGRTARTRYMSTQEKAWLVLAARELGSEGTVRGAVNGLSLPDSESTVYLHFDESELAEGVTVLNRGEEPLWHGITYSGVPRADLPPEREGFAVTRAFYTLDGRQVNLGRVRQGDTLVAVISGEGTLQRDYQAMVVDLLPAGFEIENADLEGGRDADELSWLGDLTETRHTELRDDRYVAALQMNRWDDRSFRLAYIVRAVSPGTYTLPAVYVEDMYEPIFFARSRMGRVTVGPVR